MTTQSRYPPRISLSELVRFLISDEQEDNFTKRCKNSRTINAVIVGKYFDLLSRFLSGEAHVLEIVDFLARLTLKQRREHSADTTRPRKAEETHVEEQVEIDSGSEAYFNENDDARVSSHPSQIADASALRSSVRLHLLELSLRVSTGDTDQIDDADCVRLLEEAFRNNDSPEVLFSAIEKPNTANSRHKLRANSTSSTKVEPADAYHLFEDLILALLALTAVTLTRPPISVGISGSDGGESVVSQRDAAVCDAIGTLFSRGLAAVSLVDVRAARRVALACWTVVTIVCERASSRTRLLDSLEVLHRLVAHSTVLRFTHALLNSANSSSYEASESVLTQVSGDWSVTEFALALVRHVEATVSSLKKLKVDYVHAQMRPSTSIYYGTSRRDSDDGGHHSFYNHHHSLFGKPHDLPNERNLLNSKLLSVGTARSDANSTEYACLVGRFVLLLIDTLRIATHQRRSNALAKTILDLLLRVGFCCCLLRPASDWLICRTLLSIDPNVLSLRKKTFTEAESSSSSVKCTSNATASQSVVQTAFKFIESLYAFKCNSFTVRCAVCSELDGTHVEACALGDECIRIYRALLSRTDSFASRRTASHLKVLAKLPTRFEVTAESEAEAGAEILAISSNDPAKRELRVRFVRTLKRRLVRELLLPLLLQPDPGCLTVSRIALHALVRALRSESESESEREITATSASEVDAFLPAVIGELSALAERLKRSQDRVSEQQLLALFVALLQGDGDELPRRSRRVRRNRSVQQPQPDASNSAARRQHQRATFIALLRSLVSFFRISGAPSRSWLVRLWRTLYVRIAQSAGDLGTDSESGFGTLSTPNAASRTRTMSCTGSDLPVGETWCTTALRSLEYPALAYSQLIQLVVFSTSSSGDVDWHDELELLTTLIVFCLRFCARRIDTQAAIPGSTSRANESNRFTTDELFSQLLGLMDKHWVASGNSCCGDLLIKLLDTVFDGEREREREREVAELTSTIEESIRVEPRRDGYEADRDFDEKDEGNVTMRQNVRREVSLSRSESESTVCGTDRRRRPFGSLIDAGAIRAIVRFTLDLVECLLKTEKFAEARAALARLLIASQQEYSAMACLIEIDLPTALLAKFDPLITPSSDADAATSTPTQVADAEGLAAMLRGATDLLAYFHRVSPALRTHIELYVRIASDRNTLSVARDALLDLLTSLLLTSEHLADEQPPVRSYTFSFDAGAPQPTVSVSLCCLVRVRSAELESRLLSDSQLDAAIVAVQLLVLTNRYDIVVRLRCTLAPSNDADWRRRLRGALSISCADASTGRQCLTVAELGNILVSSLLDDRFHLLTLHLHPTPVVLLDANRVGTFEIDNAGGQPLQLTATLYDSCVVRTRQCYLMSGENAPTETQLVYLAMLCQSGPVLNLPSSRSDRLQEYRVTQDSTAFMIRSLLYCQLNEALCASADESLRRGVNSLLHCADAELCIMVRECNALVQLPVEVQLFQTGGWTRVSPSAPTISAIEWPDDPDSTGLTALLEAGGVKLLFAGWLRLLDAAAVASAGRLYSCLIKIATRDTRVHLDFLRVRGSLLVRRALLCTSRVDPQAAAQMVMQLLDAATFTLTRKNEDFANTAAVRLVSFPNLLKLAFDVELVPLLKPSAVSEALRVVRDSLLCDVATLPDIVTCVEFNRSQLVAAGLLDRLLTVLYDLCANAESTSTSSSSTEEAPQSRNEVVLILADVIDRLLVQSCPADVDSIRVLVDHLMLALCAVSNFPARSRSIDATQSALFRFGSFIDQITADPTSSIDTSTMTSPPEPLVARRAVSNISLSVMRRESSTLHRVAAVRLAHTLARVAPYLSDAVFNEVCESGVLCAENLLVLLVRLCNDAQVDASLQCAVLRVVLSIVERLIHSPKTAADPALVARAAELMHVSATALCYLSPSCASSLAEMATRLCFALPLATYSAEEIDSEIVGVNFDDGPSLTDTICERLPVAVPDSLTLFVALLVTSNARTMRPAADRLRKVLRGLTLRSLVAQLRSGIVLEPVLARLLSSDLEAGALLCNVLIDCLSPLVDGEEADEFVESVLNTLLYVWLVSPTSASGRAFVAVVKALLVRLGKIETLSKAQTAVSTTVIGRGVLFMQSLCLARCRTTALSIHDEVASLISRLLDTAFREFGHGVRLRSSTLKTRSVKHLHAMLAATIRVYETMSSERSASPSFIDRLAAFAVEGSRRVAADRGVMQVKHPLAALVNRFKSKLPLDKPLLPAERSALALDLDVDIDDEKPELQASVRALQQRATTCRNSVRNVLANAEKALIERHSTLAKRLFERLGALESAESLETRLWFDLVAQPLSHADAALHETYFYPETWQRDPIETVSRERPRFVRSHLLLPDRILDSSSTHTAVSRFAFMFNRANESNAHVLQSDRSSARSSFTNVTCISSRGELHVQLLLTEIRLYILVDRAVRNSLDETLDNLACGVQSGTRSGYYAPSRAWLADSAGGILSQVFAIADVRDVRAKHYRLRNAACELLFSSGESLLLAFESVSSRNEMIAALFSALRSLWSREVVDTLFGASFETDFALLEAAARKWQRSQITNYDYLVLLNHIAGRSPNDVSQYPIFPFLLKAPSATVAAAVAANPVAGQNSKPAARQGNPTRHPSIALSNDTETSSNFAEALEQLGSGQRIDLDDETIYRALSKPISVQNPRSRQRYIEKYSMLEQFYARRGENNMEATTNTSGPRPTLGLSALASSLLGKQGRASRAARRQSSLRRCSTTRGVMTVAPHHFSAFVSNPGVLAHFLVRVPPNTHQHVQLHDGHLDLPDRLFHSVDITYRLTTSVGEAEPKELIPEFFYFADFLQNSTHIQLGSRQNGQVVDDVQLPIWANGDARLFVRVQRQAIESQPISLRLHKWIDLLFGFRQRGDPAVRAVNTFHPFIYLGSAGNADEADADADLMALAATSTSTPAMNSNSDPVNSQAILTIIATYGSVPKQLFGAPHPPKTRLRRHLMPRALSQYMQAKKDADRDRHRGRNRRRISTETDDAGSIDADADIGVDALFLSTAVELEDAIELEQDAPRQSIVQVERAAADADTMRSLELSELEDPIWTSVFSLSWGAYCGSPSEPPPERVRRVRIAAADGTVSALTTNPSPLQSYRSPVSGSVPFRRPTRQLSADPEALFSKRDSDFSGTSLSRSSSAVASVSASVHLSSGSGNHSIAQHAARFIAARRIAALSPSEETRSPMPSVELIVRDGALYFVSGQTVIDETRATPFSLAYTSDGKMDVVRSRLNALFCALRIRERIDYGDDPDDDEEDREPRRRSNNTSRSLRFLRVRDNTVESAFARVDFATASARRNEDAPEDPEAGPRVAEVETNRAAELVHYRRSSRVTATAVSYQFGCLLVGTSRGDVDVYRLVLSGSNTASGSNATASASAISVTSLQTTLHVFRPLQRCESIDEPVRFTSSTVVAIRVADDFGVAVAVCSDGRCTLLDLYRLRVLRSLVRDESFCCVATLAFSATNGDLVVAFNSRTSCTTCTSVDERAAAAAAAAAVTAADAESQVGGPLIRLALYDVNGRLVRDCELHDYVTCLTFTTLQEGVAINAIVAGLSGRIRFWQTWTLEPFRDILLDPLSESSLSDYVSALAFSVDHRYLFAVTESGYLNVWHIPDSMEERARKQNIGGSRNKFGRKRLRERERKQLDAFLNSLNFVVVR